MSGSTPFAWAIVGPGRIANKFAEAVQGMPDAELAWVVGRDLERAQAFARSWSAADAVVQAGTALDAALADPRVDAVYIATPHAQHASTIALCLAAGKPVLCEKPMVPSRAIAQPLIDQSSASGVFLMEALWSRFLPGFDQIGQWLQSGAIGRVCAVHSTFCFPAAFDASSRLFAPELAGGALLDIGIYNISLSRWVLQTSLGECPPILNFDVHGVLAPTGVDQRVSASLIFADGVAIQWVCALDACSSNSMQILGEKGHILLPRDFYQAQEVVLQRHGEAEQRVATPFGINGFEYEIAEAMRCVRAGLHESPRMPHSETLTA
ncbi:MAG: Gfo/Idh/MocA family oxidoreductase, partial [Rhodoferax sp.]|nr:Gfo/Idh/MocA family oxidoreductase [Rhodoferax sp.]